MIKYTIKNLDGNVPTYTSISFIIDFYHLLGNSVFNQCELYYINSLFFISYLSLFFINIDELYFIN